MNLVVSGPLDSAFTEAVSTLVTAQRLVRLHAGACRYEDVDASATARTAVADLCSVARVDHAFVDRPPGFASFGLLAMDMDSTLITIECIDEIADFTGKKREVAAITEATMRGEIPDFAASLTRRVALLAGADAGVLQRVFDERLKLSPGAELLLSAAKAADVQTVLVSGGFTYFSDRLVAELGLGAGHANTLEIDQGKLTGRLLGPIVDGALKARLVADAMTGFAEARAATIVVGDGANDLPMMELVDHSVAYHAKPAVQVAARHAVRFGSLATIVDFFS